METPILRVLVYSDGSHVVTQPALYSGYRCLHVREGGDPHTLGAPAVHNSESIGGIPFTREMQLLSYNINRRTNPNFTPNRWTNIYDDSTALTNGHGFGEPDDPRANFVTGEDLESPLPRLLRAIIMSGSFYRGVKENTDKGEMLTLYPGVHGIDVNAPVGYDDAFCQMVLDNLWFYYAVNADLAVASHFTQGAGMPVIIPLFLKVPTQYPLSWFDPWESDVLPNPTTFYKRI